MSRLSRWRAAQPILLLSVALAGCGGVLDECDDCQLGYPTQTETDRMMARQITSIDRGVPVIPIVYPTRNHVGVINGGKYSNLSGGYYRWEFLYFHNPDPSWGANYCYTASRWLDEFCVLALRIAVRSSLRAQWAAGNRT